MTQHGSVDRWDSWIVAVPDNMDDETIQNLMRERLEDGDLQLCEEEYEDDGQASVDITEAPADATTPDLTLTDDGLIDEDTILTASTTDRLQAEPERRRTKDSELSVH